MESMKPIACLTLFGLVAAGVYLVPGAPPRGAVAAEPAKADPKAYETKIVPFLKTYCNNCHNEKKAGGGLDLEFYKTEAIAKKDRKTWEHIQQLVTGGEMPKAKSKQPSAEEKAFFVGWIEQNLTKVDCAGPKDPGRVTIRRLNRAEYNNTIRDLCGVDFKPAENFPSDDVGYGFDNIGDVLSVQPILIEKYMAAADSILEQAIVPLDGIKSSNQIYRPQQILAIPRTAKTRETDARGREIRRIVFTEEGSAFIEKFNFPADGEYILRIRAWGTKVGTEDPKAIFRIDGKDMKTFAIDAPQDKPKTFETKARVTAGENKRVAVAFANAFTDKESKKSRTLGIETIEVEGPLGGARKPLPDAMKKLITVVPTEDGQKRSAAEASLSSFASRAFRRPVKPDEMQRLMKLFEIADKQGDKFEQAMKLPLKAILVSPHFLFRIEEDPKNPNDAKAISEFELATRLSYFLWSTMPDEELFRLAGAGELRKPGVLQSQVKRMLKDPKSSALTKNFAGQWLMLRNILTLSPDPNTFRTWDESLRSAIIRETELFFEHIVQEDRKVLEFLDANYTFLNDRLSWHYGIPGVKGGEFRKVTLPDAKRGGLVTQSSILLVTSNPTRTSPVKRGKWVYENILGLTAPPPAPDVPELEKTVLKGTLRQRMEQHRANPSCAGCHEKLDPLGFGLENFDAIGKWRELDEGTKIDASGVLPDGAKFNGPAELRKVLMGKADLFRRCLSEKLLTFALGRGLEYYDKCVLDDLVKKLKTGEDRFSALVLAIVETDAFQKRRGKRSE
ncbi:MAG: DUF1592 domain-containing protein [Gemmataceae bacterium]|nr:DUF1592 domain-containing protein [Gemmataceae bacterium]